MLVISQSSKKANCFKIQGKYPGTGGRGWTVDGVQTLTEVQVAVAHFFNAEHDKDNCPLCK
jgi:hypothetical protein